MAEILIKDKQLHSSPSKSAVPVPARLTELNNLALHLTSSQISQLATTIWYRYGQSSTEWGYAVLDQTLAFVVTQHPNFHSDTGLQTVTNFLLEISERLKGGLSQHLVRWLLHNSLQSQDISLDASIIKVFSSLTAGGALSLSLFISTYLISILQSSLDQLIKSTENITMPHALLLDSLSRLLQAVLVPPGLDFSDTDPSALNHVDLQHFRARQSTLFNDIPFLDLLRCICLIVAHEVYLEAQGALLYIDPMTSVRKYLANLPIFSCAFLRNAQAAAAIFLDYPAHNHRPLQLKILESLGQMVGQAPGMTLLYFIEAFDNLMSTDPEMIWTSSAIEEWAHSPARKAVWRLERIRVELQVYLRRLALPDNNSESMQSKSIEPSFLERLMLDSDASMAEDLVQFFTATGANQVSIF